MSTEREQFEAWLDVNMPSLMRNISTFGDEQIEIHSKAIAWATWQAARAQAPAQAPQPTLREPQPDDLLTVANIEPIDGGNTLTLLAGDLGNLIDCVGEGDAVYRVHITGMKRCDFEEMGEFDGF